MPARRPTSLLRAICSVWPLRLPHKNSIQNLQLIKFAALARPVKDIKDHRKSHTSAGLAVDTRLEVTNCFPHASALSTAEEDEDGEMQGDAAP